MRLNIRLDLTSEHVRSRLMEGLDQWVELGLLSERQVRMLAETLSDPIRSESACSQTPLSQTPLSQTPRTQSGFADFLEEDTGVAQSRARPAAGSEQSRSEPAISANRDRRVARAFRALLEEFSVIWLLFLGVFLVVASSGVLAASQWRSFTAVGQYAVLLAYTLLFWIASFWTKQRAQLQATTRMLSLTTLLLIPINFWMMDALRVMQSAVGLGVGLAAAVLLSAIALKRIETRSHQMNVLGLSWLHLGWMISGFGAWPVLATYLGTVGTAINLTYRDLAHPDLAHPDLTHPELTNREETDRANTDASRPTAAAPLSFEMLTVSLSVVILLFRSLLIAQVPLHQLGLAAGVCGWLLVRLTQRQARSGLPQFWVVSGSALLLVGWSVSISQPQPWQAIAVCALAMSLLWDGLKRSWKPEQNLALIGISAQAYWLLGALIPPGIREIVLSNLSAQLSPRPILEYEWLSLGFMPFLVGMLLFAKTLRQWHQRKLATDAEWLALGLGVCLTCLGLSNRFTLMANLLLSMVILAVVLRRRQASIRLVTLTHLVTVGAIAAALHYTSPALSILDWAYAVLGGAIAEFLLHLRLRHPQWRISTQQAGLGLCALCYALLISEASLPGVIWVWLVVPVMLTAVANHKRALRHRTIASIALLALVVHTSFIFFTVGGWLPITVSFAVGTLCAAASSRVLNNRIAALFTVGSGLMFLAISLLWLYSEAISAVNRGQLFLYWPLVVWGLWLWRRQLAKQPKRALTDHYRAAALVWSLITMNAMLVYGTFVALLTVGSPNFFGWLSAQSLEYAIAAFILLAAALLEFLYANSLYASSNENSSEWPYWSLAWTAEIVLVSALNYQGIGLKGIAIATLTAGVLSQIAGDLWTLKRPPFRPSWHGIPIAFALLGALIGHSAFTSDSGLFTIATGAILISVGRRQSVLNSFSYGGIAALSIGAYELMIYRLLQASGGSPGDGFTLLALVGIAIAYVHRLLSPLLLRYLQIPAIALQCIAHAHWPVGTAFVVFAALEGLSQPVGISLWTAVSGGLVVYAVVSGNRRLTPMLSTATYRVWTSIGLFQGLAIALHNRLVWFPDRIFFIVWGGIAACLISFLLSKVRWEALGWPLSPWESLSLWLPLSVLSVAINYTLPTQTLLIVGAFYAWMANARSQVRLSYISIGLLDWAVLRYLASQGWLTGLALSIAVGLSVLYFAEVEPVLQGSASRAQRHWIRILASALISLTALYQAEVYTPMLGYAAVTLLVCTGLIFAGLGLKVRAFLYVGTATFVLQVIRVLWLFISENSLLLWAIGIVLGLLFIWIAATFESRRSHLTNQLDTWTSALQEWE